MMIRAYLKRRPESLNTDLCQVNKVVELPGPAFDSFVFNPLAIREFIAENKELMGAEGFRNHCLLVLGRDRIDGVLVNSRRTDRVEYAAYLPNARTIVNAAVEQAAERIVREAVENTTEGSWCFYFDELYEQTGLVVTHDNGLGGMLLEALRQRPEVADVEMTGECFDAVYYLDFCKNLSSSAQPEERPVCSREQIGLKCLAFLAEHDGSEELYQMLHTDLGLKNAEIDALGFDLAHRFEDEPGMALSQTT